MRYCDFRNLKAAVVRVGALSRLANHSQFCILEKTKLVNVQVMTGMEVFKISAEYVSQFYHLTIADFLVANVSSGGGDIFNFKLSQVNLLQNLFFEGVNAKYCLNFYCP